jgi:histidinol-phosphate/aromatic aminotransferase/cobyric acid decarboxylase-like protein
LLFRHYASKGAKVWLPTDNYPVYGELARKAGAAPNEFVTLPEPKWPDATGFSGPEILVVTNPLKPLGRWLPSADVSALVQWLNGSPALRIILDTVYTFDARFHPTTLALLETQQTILLHSLTKGWLHPRLFGIALVPEQNAEALTPVFRANPPSQSSLARARVLMGQHAALPTTVGAVLNSARGGLISRLETKLPLLSRSEGYFFPVQGRWSELLDKVGVLGLPVSVFGSDREEMTILSSLTFANHR